MLKNTGGSYIIVEMPFKSMIKKFFENSGTEELKKCMFASNKRQVENPRMSDSGFTLDHIMPLHINFLKLVLRRGSFYTKLPEHIAIKKAVINPKKNYEKCFKWAVTTALNLKEMDHHDERFSLLQNYEDKCS